MPEVAAIVSASSVSAADFLSPLKKGSVAVHHGWSRSAA
jgi:hypothetical protein